MKPKVVAILETRVGAHLAALVERRGWTAMRAPALEEVADVDPTMALSLLERWRLEPFNTCIFQTGVGTRALFEATDRAGLTEEFSRLLQVARVVVRGPKPIGELNARQVRIDVRAASPFTTETVLAALADTELERCQVLVQRYGAANLVLRNGLESRGAIVHEIATYRWSLPTDTRPLLDLLAALDAGRVDAVVFTSAVQVHHLFSVALTVGHVDLALHLNRCIVASIGPVCSNCLGDYHVRPSLQADPPKLGPLMTALDAALA